MNASTSKSPRSTLAYRLWLLQLGLVSSFGLMGQTVFAQAENAAPVAPAAPVSPAAPVVSPAPVTPAAPAVPVAPPAPAVSAPAAPAAPAAPTPEPAAPAPTFAPAQPQPQSAPQPPVEVVTPNDIVPSAIPTAEPTAEQPPSDAPAVAGTSSPVTNPADLGAVFVDPTDYSVGATQPSVIFSERASGCQFSVQNGQVPGGACAQAPAPTQTASGPGRVGPEGRSFSVGPVSISASGVQISGGTTAASRDYYNRAARPIVNLQLGEKFIFPLSMPAPITSLFGWREHPVFGGQRFHSGTDLGAPLGTPIVATQAGRVAIADFLGGYGLTVVLRHNEDDLESRYAHMARLLVNPGDWVEQGEVIGLVGNTGNSTGPHLHFELRQLTADGWVALNPDLLIQQTLANLMQSLNNPLLALGTPAEPEAAEKSESELEAGAKLPFRPAQPNAN